MSLGGGCVTIVDSTLTKRTREEGVVAIVSSPDPPEKWKGESGKWTWVEVYTLQNVTFSEPSVTSRAF